MTYVVYNTKTTEIIEGKNTRSYATIGAAKAAVTRAWKDYIAKINRTGECHSVYEDPQFVYGIAETTHYFCSIEKKVERVNAMTGEKFMESVNTPYYCSPSSETYWSS